jgi:hypothetical protein
MTAILLLLLSQDPSPQDLQTQIDELKAKVENLEAQNSWVNRVTLKFSGYLDFGFFWVQGNGSGVRKDFGGALGYRGQLLDTWVLSGDPLSTAVNARGDVADVGDSRAIRADPVHAGAHPSFMVNSLSFGLFVTFTDSLTLTASIDFLPRDRDLSDPHAIGDLFDVKLAYLRYELQTGFMTLAIEVGKINSLLGVEYRTQDAPQRITVTPSIICRYTCGRPLGIRANAEFFDGTLEVGLAVTNGTHQVDYFTFFNQTDSNNFKTVAGKVAVHLPVGRDLELNATGAVGPQDRQSDDGMPQWHYGFAGLLDIGDFTAAAEFVNGKATGKGACTDAPCLTYHGAYGLVAWRATLIFQPYVRVDWRSARHFQAGQFAYVSDVLRATFGVRAEFGRYVIVKAEYTLNNELGLASQFPDDVFTTSLVVRY